MRHGVCGAIPLTEMGWFITETPKRDMWLCGACGNQYTYRIVEGAEGDSRGQRLHQFIIFLAIPFAKGNKIQCARAQAPSDCLIN